MVKWKVPWANSTFESGRALPTLPTNRPTRVAPEGSISSQEHASPRQVWTVMSHLPARPRAPSGICLPLGFGLAAPDIAARPITSAIIPDTQPPIPLFTIHHLPEFSLKRRFHLVQIPLNKRFCSALDGCV